MSKLFSLAFCLTLAASPAMSSNMQLLSDVRSVQASGTASTFVSRTYDDGRNEVSQELQTKQLVPVVHPPNTYGSFVASDGMALRTAYATLDGQGAQRSLVSSSLISFEGVADVLATSDTDSIVGPDYIEDIQGQAQGSARSSFSASFALDTRLIMDLAMTSNLTLQRLNGFTFSLVGDNGFAWMDPYQIDSNGEIQFTFNTQLDLAPGTYTLNAQLSAGAFAAGGQQRAGRATSEFSLTTSPVPEPESWQLALAGGAVLLATRARRRGR
jgi:PEP-CTERM motif